MLWHRIQIPKGIGLITETACDSSSLRFGTVWLGSKILLPYTCTTWLVPPVGSFFVTPIDFWPLPAGFSYVGLCTVAQPGEGSRDNYGGKMRGKQTLTVPEKAVNTDVVKLPI